MADPLPFGVGSPVEPTVDQAGTVNALAGAIWNLPKHLIDASANAVPGLRREDYTDNPTAPQPNQPMYDAVGDTALGLLGGSGWAPAEANSLRMGIKAFHGSPHDFDKFDMSKLGTGEGAQVYGHGLYFAGNPAVAESYRASLAGTPRIKFGDTTIRSPSELRDLFPNLSTDVRYPMHHTLDQMQHGVSFEDALKYTKDQYSHYQPSDLAQAESLLRQHNPSLLDPRGKMYEVNLETDPNHLLDWDKPREAQSAAVLKALREVNPNPFNTGTMFPPSMRGNAMYNQMTDATWHRARGREVQTTGSPYNPANASKVLDEIGIPGIKYLDQGSRGGSANPTHNYVAFNDKIIEILKKYGIAGVPAAGAAAGVAQEQEKQ